MFLKTLSGRFLLLTIIFVMLAEIVIFLPSVARFRLDYLQERLERSQIATLALLATPNDMVSADLEAELLANAEVLNITLRRDATRELILSSPMTSMIEERFDLRGASAWRLMQDAVKVLLSADNRTILVLGEPVKQAGLMIEAAMKERPLRQAMIAYGKNVFKLSLAISVISAALLFFAVRRFLVRPISRVVQQIEAFGEDPEDVRRIIQPQARVTELKGAEIALNSMQTQLQSSLKQKKRLAELGSAVSKISHDLRNILTTTQLLADRMENSDDPAVKRTAPKLLGSLSRAVSLCERTLTYGKAEEPAPNLSPFDLGELLENVAENERLAIQDNQVTITVELPQPVRMTADFEQIHRAISNLVRNACQVFNNREGSGNVIIHGSEDETNWLITVRDNGPGLPAKAREHLFRPFHGSVRSGGTGLGLAISAELVKGHGGTLDLVHSTDRGSEFQIALPKN